MLYDNEMQKRIILTALEQMPARGHEAVLALGRVMQEASAGQIAPPAPEPTPRPEVAAALNGAGMGPHGVAEGARVVEYEGEDGA